MLNFFFSNSGCCVCDVVFGLHGQQSTETVDAIARFEVTDTGYVIPDDQQDKMFQPFFRAQMDETKYIEGTGLGLYLVKRIIERNKGVILFRSQYGVGSTFGFELPIA